jgi:hypothetical protein
MNLQFMIVMFTCIYSHIFVGHGLPSYNYVILLNRVLKSEKFASTASVICDCNQYIMKIM